MSDGRFRYRAWDKVNKIMYTGLPYSGAGKTGKVTMDIVLKHPSVYVLMESTGAYTDNVLVFEGDYLSDSNTIWEVVYSEIANGFYAKSVCGSETGSFSLYYLCNECNSGKKVTIAGNKYEYTGPISELLKIEV